MCRGAHRLARHHLVANAGVALAAAHVAGFSGGEDGAIRARILGPSHHPVGERKEGELRALADADGRRAGVEGAGVT